jgi:hypothetical protein
VKCNTHTSNTQVVGVVLSQPRKVLSGACTSLISTLVVAHGGDPTVMPPWMWRPALEALGQGVMACTTPGAASPLQVAQFTNSHHTHTHTHCDTLRHVRLYYESRVFMNHSAPHTIIKIYHCCCNNAITQMHACKAQRNQINTSML